MRARHLVLAVVTVILTSVPVLAQRTLIEGIVVRVNDRILTISDVRQRLAEREAEAGRPIPADQLPALVAEIADELCILERATELKIEIVPEEIDAAMKQLREQNNAPDDAAFERMLTSMGMSVQMMRERMRETITMNRLLSREVGTLPVTEEELRQRYERDKEQFRLPERVHLEHIVLTVSKEPGDADAKLAAARRLAAAARAGSDFKGLIQAEVDAKRGTGGDLGVVAVPDLRSEVRDAVAGLKPGDVSEPFTSSAGVHVVKVLERIPPAHKPFTEVVEELRQRELAERYRTHLLSIVTGLKKRFTVETHPELLTAHK